MLDYMITGAEVYDGDGGDPAMVAVGISGDRIAYVGEPLGAGAARETIDGRGMLLSPGFIDVHASTGLGYFFDHAGDHKLYQGVTTELFGNCGTSPGPIGPHLEATMRRLSEKIGFPFAWRSLAEYFAQIEARGLPLNVASLVGHSTLRGGALPHWETVTPDQHTAMETQLAQAMVDGAFGLSSGLIYPPGCFAHIDELIALARVARHHGGFYASHIRDERDQVGQAVDEALEIGRAARIPVLVSHLKAADRPNWGKIPDILATIERVRAEHDLKVAVDVYPYTAVSTKMRAFLPKELLADGIEAVPAKLAEAAWRERCRDHVIERQTDFDNMVIISDEVPDTAGKSVARIAAERGQSAADAACDLVAANPELWMVYHCIDEADMDAAMLWPDAMVCSDSWSYPVNAPHQIGEPHPRTYGAFSRFLKRYVFDRSMLTYGAAVRKATAMPADFIGLVDRGRIRVGGKADILLLNPGTFADNATYLQPRSFSSGVSYLWLNGKLSFRQGVPTNDLNGALLRHRP